VSHINADHRRIIKLQRHVLMSVKADVRKSLGAQTKQIRRYYESYKREFRKPVRHSNKEELLKECVKSHIILMGDYHTFAQSQKTALRLLRELINWETPITLALEIFPSTYQSLVEKYLDGTLEETEFLKQTNYQTTWGFPWEHFRPLFVFAKEHKISILVLNLLNESLEARDTHAAAIIAEHANQNPKHKIFALYGDLHLAKNHIPKYIKNELRKKNTNRRVLVIFQNSESLYWKLAAQRMEHSVDVLKLHQNRYCVMNAAPWVKLQSYLQWAEASELFEAEDGFSIHLHEMAQDRLKNLAEVLNLKIPKDFDINIQTVHNLVFLNHLNHDPSLRREELKMIKYSVLGNRTFFLPNKNLIYLASTSVNALCEGVSMLAHSILSHNKTFFWDTKNHFFGAVISYMLAYFGSKILNYKRKCDLENDYQFLLERRLPKKVLPQERLQRKIAKLVLAHCKAQREYLRGNSFRMPTFLKGTSRLPIFLETTRSLGFILGEKIFTSHIEGRFSIEKIESIFLTQHLDNPRETKKLYLKILTSLESTSLAHSSKMDLL